MPQEHSPPSRLRLVVAVAVLALTVRAGARRAGPLPALGAFLEPAHGVWSLARSAEHPRSATSTLSGLSAEVQVIYDDRAVPHIFATSEEDAYRALGYVVARDRLFQMWLQTVAASGRLTEIAGARALPLDREMRQLGLPRAAERLAASLPDSSMPARVTQSYADGVNAYLAAMSKAEQPLEMRLLGARMTKWDAVNSYHLFGRMGWLLANISLERDRAAAAAVVGTVAAAALFPDRVSLNEPIQPTGLGAPRIDSTPLPPPGVPDTVAVLVAAAMGDLRSAAALLRGTGDGEPTSMASNNWAVAPRRTRDGYALLAGDPHLELSLPSIWYEVHLVVPGVLDVHGVTIPGAPGVIIGFNRDVAWTFTNTGADVMDFWVEHVDDERSPTRYELDGAWRPLERRIERYLDQRGAVVATDTLRFTHRGPMRRTRGRWLSMRWTVLEAGREGIAFRDAAHARTAAELQDAMATSFLAPAQNMLAADRAGHIAIRSTGRFPLRADDGDGARIRDGRSTASDWRGSLPVAQYPQSIDPPQGFLASANQQPVDAGRGAAWFGGSYDPWRALRINRLLRADSAVTVETMRRFQTDPGSARADLFVPGFLEAARRVSSRPGAPNRDAIAESGLLLAQWDRRYTRDNRRAVLFEAAMRELTRRTWDELRAPGADGLARVATPGSDVMARLLADSASVWWDDRSTAGVERRDDILAASLAAALDTTRRELGDPGGDAWRWDRVRHANVKHLLQIPSLSALDLPANGGPNTLSPSAGSGVHGASWRMVVELGDTLRAWATYPGGQSGNPASARYRDRIPQWVAGQLSPLRSPRSPGELREGERRATLTLRPGAGR